ncbi:mutator type transposase [Tanacetum coccineum]
MALGQCLCISRLKKCIWEVRRDLVVGWGSLTEDHTCHTIEEEIKACTSRFLSDHVIKTLATNPHIPMRAVQDQRKKQFDVGISKMRAFRAKRFASDTMTGSPFLGQILIAVGVDANNGIYLVAYSIVEAESKASWCWFLNLLREDLCIEVNFNYTLISNRQKVLIQDIASVFPSAENRFCVKHIHENMKQLLDGREQPIITCLEFMRECLMKRIIVVPKVIAKTVGPLTPTVTCIFDAIEKAATDYIVDWNGGYLYQVIGPYRDKCIVKIDRMVCSCRKWELIGILCKHVVAAIYNMCDNGMGVGIPEHWVHASYRLETWAHVYSFKINPCKLSKKGKSVNCSKCGNLGHSKKGCKGQGGAIVKEQDKLLVQEMSLLKLLVLVNRVKHQDKLLVQGIPQVKLVVLVNREKDQYKVLVQGMPQVKLLVLVNLV